MTVGWLNISLFLQICSLLPWDDRGMTDDPLGEPLAKLPACARGSVWELKAGSSQGDPKA